MDFLAAHADLIFAMGAVTLSAALVPAVFSQLKPPRLTCALTGGVLWVYAVTFLVVDLLLSGILTGVTAGGWTILLVQRRLKA